MTDHCCLHPFTHCCSCIAAASADAGMKLAAVGDNTDDMAAGQLSNKNSSHFNAINKVHWNKLPSIEVATNLISLTHDIDLDL